MKIMTYIWKMMNSLYTVTMKLQEIIMRQLQTMAMEIMIQIWRRMNSLSLVTMKLQDSSGMFKPGTEVLLIIIRTMLLLAKKVFNSKVTMGRVVAKLTVAYREIKIEIG